MPCYVREKCFDQNSFFFIFSPVLNSTVYKKKTKIPAGSDVCVKL